MRALLCEANVSEGRRPEVVEALGAAVRGIEGVRLADLSSDPDHNRCVVTFLGPPDRVERAARAMAEVALDRIDMRAHRGQHPRLGALDVVPFVPLGELEMERAVRAARELGQFLAERGVPVFYYEAAASRPERKSLPAIRRGGYEGLAAKLRQPEWAPDAGPAEPHPSAGATVIGARGPLVRLNVNLRSTDVDGARAIARQVREIDGGFPCVRALGFALEDRGMVQVSMNLTDYTRTGIAEVLAGVCEAAAGVGVDVAGTEVIGLVPMAALEPLVKKALQAPDFTVSQVIEAALL